MQTEAKERGILLNQEMVKAVLDGRKTQTRRPVTVPWNRGKRCRPYSPYYVESDGKLLAMDEYGDYHPIEKTTLSPYGKVGDRLYVRERARLIDTGYAGVPTGTFQYAADGKITKEIEIPDRIKRIKPGNCCSNGCFKELARIWLEITGVRVERVQDISLNDIEREGVLYDNKRAGRGHMREKWAFLWQSLYGESWERNDWVWVYDFTRTKK